MPAGHAHRYSAGFFSGHSGAVRSSAEILVPLVMDLVGPRSVIDVGCGIGDWLAVFSEHGVADVVGVDGAYVDTSLLQIADELFSRPT